MNDILHVIGRNAGKFCSVFPKKQIKVEIFRITITASTPYIIL